MTTHELSPCVIEGGIGFRVIRHVPRRQAGKLLQPEIGARLKSYHFTVALQHGDEGTKRARLSPSL